MSRVVVTREIPASASEVWEIFTDLGGRGSWLSEVERVEIITDGPFGQGTRWRETRVDSRGQQVTEELVVTAMDPPKSCTIALAGSTAHNHLTYLFEPVEFAHIRVGPRRNGTTVSAVVEGRPHGIANRLLGFFLGGFAARTVEGSLRDELDALAAACHARRSTGSAAA
jgi:uncharacterized protein YndB with AHSA1/START domain